MARCAWALAVFLSVAPLPVLAQDSNFRPYIVGGRAAGMGGAFTALSDDGSGAYHNPGGLAFTRASSVSFALSAYGLVGGTIKNALGDGHDFRYQDVNPLPVDTAGIKKLGEVDPATGAAKHTLYFTVILPDAFDTDDRDQLDLRQNAFFSRRSVQTIWVGGGYAIRLGSVGIGFGAFGLLGTSTTFLDLNQGLADGSQFEVISARNDETVYGFVGSLGVRWDVTQHLHLGASIFSPEVGGGSRTAFARVAVAGTNGGVLVVNQADDLSTSPTLPLRAQLGLAWEDGPLTLSADGIVLGHREVRDNPERANSGLDRHVIRRAVANAALGVEYVVADRFPLRAGFFTDFAASDPNSTSAENTSHVDHYGLTLAAGLRTEHVQTDVGITGWYGSGTDVIPSNLDFTQLKRTDSTEYAIFLFLGTSYEF